MRQVGSSSLTRDRTQGPLHWECAVLPQGSPCQCLFSCLLAPGVYVSSTCLFVAFVPAGVGLLSSCLQVFLVSSSLDINPHLFGQGEDLLSFCHLSTYLLIYSFFLRHLGASCQHQDVHPQKNVYFILLNHSTLIKISKRRPIGITNLLKGFKT